MKPLCVATLTHFRTRSLNDQERDVFQRGRRVKFERQSAHMRALMAMPPREWPPGGHAGRYVVELCRVAPGQPLDSDNLQGACKHVRDGICDRLGVDDGDTARVRFVYGQEHGPWGVRFAISLEETETLATGPEAA